MHGIWHRRHFVHRVARRLQAISRDEPVFRSCRRHIVVFSRSDVGQREKSGQPAQNVLHSRHHLRQLQNGREGRHHPASGTTFHQESLQSVRCRHSLLGRIASIPGRSQKLRGQAHVLGLLGLCNQLWDVPQILVRPRLQRSPWIPRSAKTSGLGQVG